jgi:HlyD family secretion protein
MKKAIPVIIVVVVLGCAAYLLLGGKRGGPKFLTEKITRGDIVVTVTATGTVNAVTTVLVGTQASGRIRGLFADFNSTVKKGQLIAQIDPAVFQAQVDQARANLSNADANRVKAEATSTDAARTMNRYRGLFARNLVARSDLDTAETNAATAAASLTAARTVVDQTRAALELAETNLGYTRIISPVDGTVISRNVDVGQTVAASFQTPTLFSIAVDLMKMQIDTSVDEADVSGVKVGQPVEFDVDAYPERTFTGRVAQVRNAAVVVQNVVTYDVVVEVDNSDLSLRPGMTANVSIITARVENVLRIPNAALRFKPSEKPGPQARARETGAATKGPAVWILEKGAPRRVAVAVGLSDGTSAELIRGEVREGQDVITESLSRPKEAAAFGPRMF